MCSRFKARKNVSLIGFMTRKNQKSQLENKSEQRSDPSAQLPEWLTPAPDGVILAIHAQPGAKRNAIVGEYNSRLKLSLNAPPVDGKANAKLTAFLAEKLGVAKSAVRLVSGETQRTKRFAVTGVDVQTALAALAKD